MRQVAIKKFFVLVLIFSLIVPSLLTSFAPQASAAGESIADAIANNSGSGTVEGYIVGTTTNGPNYKTEGPFTVATNIAIADSATERDSVKILPVQLPTGSIRSVLNLVDNPHLLGAKVKLTGSLEVYFGVPGLKNLTDFEILESQDPIEEPPTNTEPGTIAEARSKNGQTVTVEGIVTADNSAIGGGKLSTYIQDETAGINVFAFDGSTFPDLKEGQSIKITGNITSYKGLTEIVPSANGIEVISEGNDLPQPKEITLKDLAASETAEPLEGQLVKVAGFVSSVPSSPAGGGYNVSIIDQDFNSTTVRVMTETNAIDAIEEGKWYDFTSIVSQYDSYQVLPRKATDIVALDPQPEAPQSAGEYTSTVKSVVDGDTIHLETPVLGTTKVRYVNMDTPETYHTPVTPEDESQKFHGEQAKAYLNELLQPGDEVIVKVGEEATDTYGRLLAQIIRKEDNVNTNLEMVKQGYASTYFIWPVGDMDEYAQYQAAVKEAKGNQLGIWNPENPLAELPFEFRAREEGKGLLRYVGNSETMKYVSPENFEEVPVEARVFFASTEEAEANGYTAVSENPTENLLLQLLSINDLHGKIDQSYTLDINGDKVNDGTYGRMDYVAAYLNDRKQDNPNTLLVHAGDIIGGSSPVSALLQDEPTVEIMEAIGFDVGVVGNHEFDEGLSELQRIIKGGDHPKGTENYDGQNFPLLCANCEYKATGEDVLEPYFIKEVDGVKVGFVGAITPTTAGKVIPDGIKDINFTDPTAGVNEAVAELKEQGVKSIVVLGHLTASQNGDSVTGEAATLANGVDDEVDVIFAGDNHQVVNGTVDNKLIVQAWEYGKALADIDLEIDRTTGDIVKKTAEIVYVDQSKIDADPVVAEILSKYENRVASIINEVVGQAATAIEGGYGVKGPFGDNALGNLIADGMAAEMNSDFALMNGGGIRDNLNAGDITWGEIFNIQPFGNVLTKLEIKGADLFTIMKAQLSTQYGPDYSISGFTYKYDPATLEVKDITLKDGSKIDLEKTYTVTVNNFMAAATSGKYGPIGLLGKNPVVGPEDLEATVNYVRSFNEPISYEVEGRISDDFVAPSINITLSTPDLEDGTYSKEALVTLEATDESAGVATVEYKLNDGEWIAYSQPFTISEAGETIISYRAKDKVGNVEETKTATVMIKVSEQPEEPTQPENLEDLKEAVKSADVNRGVKTSILVHIVRAELNFELSKQVRFLSHFFEQRGYEILEDLNKKVKKYPKNVMSKEDKKTITEGIQYVIDNETETN
ncbi:DUF6359 domain-containing protein [Metabacillus herbersteinensis]|uniref:DUF6359 domain-containing protein n=1 Tax=Metabacillus herbersteinensis TaxID=283816 RepID=A0ABV6GES2_9BACI